MQRTLIKRSNRFYEHNLVDSEMLCPELENKANSNQINEMNNGFSLN